MESYFEKTLFFSEISVNFSDIETGFLSIRCDYTIEINAHIDSNAPR